MGKIKQLAGQTVWYGLSNIGGRFLNYLITPIVTYIVGSAAGMAELGVYGILYGWIAFLNIVFTYGFETAFFRFVNKEKVEEETLFQTAFTSHVVSTVVLVIVIGLFRVPLGDFIGVHGHYDYILLCLFIIGFDTFSVIPKAKLRKDERPRKFAFVNLTGVTIYVLLVIFFFAFLPDIAEKTSREGIRNWYQQQTNVDFLLKANCVQAFLTFVLLFYEWRSIKFKGNAALWKKLWRYSAPLMVVGLGGMINEVVDRQMLGKMIVGSQQYADIQISIYIYCYKLAIFVTLFTFAFRMAADPFFFSQYKKKDAKETYARVMKWFVITLASAFLFTALFLDVWQYMIGKPYRAGLPVVPVLLGANVCLGIYYNLAIWYKLADMNKVGMFITLFGAVITLLGNYFFIPYFGFYASAWTRLVCYLTMMILCWAIGRKYYPIPYNIKRIFTYIGVMLLLFFIHEGLSAFSSSFIFRVGSGMFLFVAFFAVVGYKEKEELVRMPYVGRFFSRYVEN